MNTFLDDLLTRLEQLIFDYHVKILQVEDRKATLTRRGGSSGTVNAYLYAELVAKKAELEEELVPYQFLYDELKVYKDRNRETPESYLAIIRNQIIGILAEEERYEECIAIQRFALEAERGLLAQKAA